MKGDYGKISKKIKKLLNSLDKNNDQKVSKE